MTHQSTPTTGRTSVSEPVSLLHHTNSNSDGTVESFAALPHLCIHRDIGTLTTFDFHLMARDRAAARGWLEAISMGMVR